MRKKSLFVWSLVAALFMTGCSDQSEEVGGVSGKTGTFELNIAFADPGSGTRAPSTHIPTTSWGNIKQIQFFLYDGTGKIAWSAIEKPADGSVSGTGKKYTYATVPADTYTLVAVANAYSSTDAVTTYTSGAKQLWTVANVYNRTAANLDIRHKESSWSGAISGSVLPTVTGLTPHTQPSEVFMGSSTGVVVSSTATATATISLKREVSMMRVRLDQTTYAAAVGNVDFVHTNAAVMLYNLPEKMGIQEGNSGGVVNNSVAANALFAPGAYSTTATNYLDGNYTAWKEVMVFPNNGGRVNNANTGAKATKPYFIVICGIAKTGHHYVGGAAANAGDPVFWYGQINEVFTPNNIREVDVILKTGGSPTPPPGIVEYGGLEITVNKPLDWGSIVTAGPIEL